jgi:predicted metalloprotease with PDZ domain
MTTEDRQRKRQLMRVAIPAAICLVTIVAIAWGTRVWQQGATTGAVLPMELRGQWLGMRLTATGSQSAADLGVPPEIKGVVVADVQGGSRALLAGLAAGDVVTRVNGRSVTDLLDMYNLSSRIDNTRPMQVEFLRAGRPMVASMLPPESMVPASGPTAPGARQPSASEGAGWTGVGANDPNTTPVRGAVRAP